MASAPAAASSVAHQKRKRSAGAEDVLNAKTKKKAATKANPKTPSAQDDHAIDLELKRVNDLLQKEETSQKQTWQIGKRLKKLMESYPGMATRKMLDAFFLWGTALARLASLNEDPTLAEAAADKFQEMHALSSGDDSAMGPVGYSLWASSLLIVATETRQKDVLDQALSKFEQAVEVDGGTTFETRFQYAKALKEGGDLVKFLENDSGSTSSSTNSYIDYYKRALALCVELEEIYARESAKAGEQQAGPSGSAAAHGGDSDNGSDEEDEEDEDDDKVLLEDFAEVKLLQAVLSGAIEGETSTGDSFNATLALFRKALEISPDSPDALMELSSYTSKKFLQQLQGEALSSVDWAREFAAIEAQYAAVLADAGFDITECHEICVRKDTRQQEEPEEEEIDERVPHLLHALGKALASFAVGQVNLSQTKKAQSSASVQSSPRFVHAVEVLRAAHHFHDKLGCYPLAWLYAYPGAEDEANCRTWLETAESYGVLDDELQVEEFKTMHDKPWFEKFLTPAEEIGEDEMEGGKDDDDASDDEE